ncbi:MAG: LPS assembly lipoprotein LptE [Pseudomonadota bacterium]
MSSFDPRLILITALLALSACGFTPVYGPGSQAQALRGAVSFGTPDSPGAFELVRELELRFGVADEAIYRLAVDVALDETESVITRTSEIERFSITGVATFTLLNTDSDPVAKGTTQAFTSYSASGSPMATRAAREDAQSRLMVILADQIALRLAAEVS